MLLKDKVCLVTGAGKGIGRATLDAFLKEGAFVYANDIIEDSLMDYKNNPNVEIMYFDVADSAKNKESIFFFF